MNERTRRRVERLEAQREPRAPVNLLVLYPGDPDPAPEEAARYADVRRVVFVPPPDTEEPERVPQ